MTTPEPSPCVPDDTGRCVAENHIHEQRPEEPWVDVFDGIDARLDKLEATDSIILEMIHSDYALITDVEEQASSAASVEYVDNNRHMDHEIMATYNARLESLEQSRDVTTDVVLKQQARLEALERKIDANIQYLQAQMDVNDPYLQKQIDDLRTRLDRIPAADET